MIEIKAGSKALSLILFSIAAFVLATLVWEVSVCDSRLGSSEQCSDSEAAWFATLSKPSVVLEEFRAMDDGMKGELWDRSKATLIVSLMSIFYICIITFAMIIAGTCMLYKFGWNLFAWLYSIMWMLQVIPILSYVSILGALAGQWETPSVDNIVLGVIIGLFPMVSEIWLGMANIPKSHQELLRVFNANLLQVIKIGVFPRITKSFFSGLYVAVPLAIVGVVLADIAGGTFVGLGATINANVTSLDKKHVVWIATFGIVAISLSILLLVTILEWLFAQKFSWYGDTD